MAAEPNDDGGERTIREAVIPIRWEEPTDLTILYANHFWVRLQDGQFLMTFGQAELPMAEFSDERVAQLQRDGLSVKAVARLSVPPIKLEQIIDALARIHGIWLGQQKEDSPE